MNQPPVLPQPPFGDDTDEALNALLDGELDAFAAERAMTEAAVHAELRSWPGYAARVSALEAVRAAMQVPAPALDDLTRRRLVRNAMDAVPAQPARAPQSRSWARWTAVAAAAVLVIGGIGVAISSMSGGNDSSRSASSSATAPLRGNVGDLGDVTSPAALRGLLDRRAGRASTSTTAPSSSSAAGSTADSSAADSSEAQRLNRAAALPPTTESATPTTLGADACARRLAGERKTTFVGTGTSKGAPVTIVGIAEGGRTIVFVVSSTDCTNVLASISR